MAKMELTNYNDSTSSNISDALHSYFSQFSEEGESTCERLTLVVDNARIPLSDEMASRCNAEMSFSRSMSAISSVSFPPAFVKETARWKSTHGNGHKSDLCLVAPRRSRDDMCLSRGGAGSEIITEFNSTILGEISSEGKSCSLSSSESSGTEKWLNELPIG